MLPVFERCHAVVDEAVWQATPRSLSSRRRCTGSVAVRRPTRTPQADERYRDDGSSGILLVSILAEAGFDARGVAVDRASVGREAGLGRGRRRKFPGSGESAQASGCSRLGTAVILV
jgi:hypothetical protein